MGRIDYSQLIDFIQDAIKRKGITPNKLAIVSGVPAQSLYRFLNGERGLEPASISKLATGLGVNPFELHKLIPGGILGESITNDDPTAKALRVQLIAKFNQLDAAGQKTLVDLAEALKISSPAPPKKPSNRGKGNPRTRA